MTCETKEIEFSVETGEDYVEGTWEPSMEGMILRVGFSESIFRFSSLWKEGEMGH